MNQIRMGLLDLMVNFLDLVCFQTNFWPVFFSEFFALNQMNFQGVFFHNTKRLLNGFKVVVSDLKAQTVNKKFQAGFNIGIKNIGNKFVEFHFPKF